MADDQRPGGSGALPNAERAPGQPAKPADQAAPAAAPKPAAPAAHATPSKAPAAMAAVPWDSGLARELKDRFGEQVCETATYLGQNFAVVRPGAVIPVLEYLKLEADFDYLVDVTAVDWPARAERFDLVYIVYSFARNERVRIKTSIPEGYRPESAVRVYLTANWLEREVYDMFGIEFAGH